MSRTWKREYAKKEVITLKNKQLHQSSELELKKVLKTNINKNLSR